MNAKFIDPAVPFVPDVIPVNEVLGRHSTHGKAFPFKHITILQRFTGINPQILIYPYLFPKGIGLIVPGLVPSPLGEVVDYAPSWVEVCVTLGILALGIFVVTVLLKPALIIEQKFEAEH